MKKLSLLIGILVWVSFFIPAGLLSQVPDLFFTPTTGTGITGNGPNSFYTRCIAGNKGRGAFVNNGNNQHFVHYKTLKLETGQCWSGWKDFFYRQYIAPGDSDEYNQGYTIFGKGTYIVWADLNANTPRSYKESNYQNNDIYFAFYYTDTVFPGGLDWVGISRPDLVTKQNMQSIDKCK